MNIEMPKILIPTDEEVMEVTLGPARMSDHMKQLLDSPRSSDTWLPKTMGGASKSDYYENAMLDHAFNDPAHTAVTPWLALCTAVPTDASTGVTIVEATYTGYARKQIANADMSAAASGSKTNSAAVTFAACTAGTSTIIGAALVDNATTSLGNVFYWFTVTSVVISTTQTPATVAIGALVCTED